MSRHTKTQKTEDGDEPKRASPLPLPLKLPLPLSKATANWGFKTYGVAKGASVSRTPGNVMRLNYAAGEVGSSSGISAHATVPSVFPCDDVCLSYDVFLPNTWLPVRGGKWPGLILGNGASGGEWSHDGGSARIVFKPSGAKHTKDATDTGAVGLGYVYVPLQIGPRKDFKTLIPGYADAFDPTAKGEHVWPSGVNALKIGAWNTVKLHVKLNSKDKADGVLSVTINGETRSIRTMRWRARDSLRIEGISLVSFYGGSERSCAAPKDGFVLFRDFTLSRP